MPLCKNGLHDLSLPNARKPKKSGSQCRECWRTANARYRGSEKGKQTLERYLATQSGRETVQRKRYTEFKSFLNQRILSKLAHINNLKGELNDIKEN